MYLLKGRALSHVCGGRQHLVCTVSFSSQFTKPKIIVLTIMMCTEIVMEYSCSYRMEFGVFIETTTSVSMSHFCV